VAMNICVIGEYFKAHKIGKSKKLKCTHRLFVHNRPMSHTNFCHTAEVQRLISDIQFAYAFLSGPIKQLKILQVKSVINTLKSSIKQTFIPLGEVRLHAKQREQNLSKHPDSTQAKN